MHTVHKTPAIALTSRASQDLGADLLVLPVFEDDDLADEAGVDEATGGDVSAARARRAYIGNALDVRVPALRGWNAMRVALIRVGPRKDSSADKLRRASAAGGLAARQRRVTRVAIVHRAGTSVAPDRAAQVMAEGVILANFDGAPYKTTEPPRVWLDSVQLRPGGESSGAEASAEAAAAIEQALERGRVLGESSNLARELCNEPGNNLTPQVFADRATAVAKEAGLKVEVLDEKRIAELKMGLLLGVARGSVEPPRLMVLRHEPKGV